MNWLIKRRKKLPSTERKEGGGGTGAEGKVRSLAWALLSGDVQ